MEARAFAPMVKKLGIKKADFLSTNNDFGLGAAKEFSDMLKAQGVQVGVMETMDPKATDFSAQLAKIKASGGDTLFVTTAVEQITLILKQAKEQQLKARIITTGGSNSPDQLIQQAGDAANGSMHLVFFTPWFPEAVKNPDLAKKFVAEWNARKYTVGGLTEGFRGWDGVMTIVAAIKAAGKAEPAGDPEGAVEREGQGHQRRHRVHQAGAGGQGKRAERAERVPREDRERQGHEELTGTPATGVTARGVPSPARRGPITSPSTFTGGPWSGAADAGRGPSFGA